MPEKKDKAFYIKVKKQIETGGTAALHRHLLDLPLEGFNEHTPVPVTQAKTDLINLNKDAFPQFFQELADHEIGNVPFVPFIGDDIWELFKSWCQKNGERPGKKKYMMAALTRMPGMDKLERQHVRIRDEGDVQRTIYYPPGCGQRSAGMLIGEFHAKSIENFRTAASAYYKGGAKFYDGGGHE